MNFLIDTIKEYHSYGSHSYRSRYDFITEFFDYKIVGEYDIRWEPKDYHRDLIIEWARNILYYATKGTAAGQALERAILDEIREDACNRIIEALEAVAEDLSDEIYEQEGPKETDASGST